MADIIKWYQVRRNPPMVWAILWILGCMACHPTPTQENKEDTTQSGAIAQEESSESSRSTLPPTSGSDSLEQSVREQGLIRVRSLDTTIRVDLRYSTTRNFVGADVYGDFHEAYLQPEPARMLARANALLKEKHPGYTLHIYDAVRPRRVQQLLWDRLDYPPEQRRKYVADPQEGSIHNYGAAVDLTIADAETGVPLDMGTDFDHFGVLAYPVQEEAMLAQGRLSEEQVSKRRLLRDVMTRAGFSPITSEWWHFNAMSREQAAHRYGIVE